MDDRNEENGSDFDNLWLSCQAKGREQLTKHQAKAGRLAFKEVGKKAGLMASMAVYDVGPELVERSGHEVVAYGPEVVDNVQNIWFF